MLLDVIEEPGRFIGQQSVQTLSELQLSQAE